MSYKKYVLMPISFSFSALVLFFLGVTRNDQTALIGFSINFLFAVLFWCLWFNLRAAAKAVSNQEVEN